MSIPTYDDVLAARERIRGYAVRTPLMHSPLLSERLGATVYLKPETLQRTGSFKFRGAWNAVQSLQGGGKQSVVACSSGNHAQGVAEAARLTGRRATIVMPNDAPALKRARTEAYGARVVGYDRGSEDRDAIADAISREEGAAFIHPYDNPDVIAGQGTVGAEIADDLERNNATADVVLVPCSGGGLSAGTALAITTRFPEAAVYAVEPRGFEDYRKSLESGQITPNELKSGSICDALQAPQPGGIGWEINRKRLAGALAATDEDVLWTVGFAFDELRLVVEPGGAIGLAVLLTGGLDVSGKTCVVVLSGGNIADEILTRAVQSYRSAPAKAVSPK